MIQSITGKVDFLTITTTCGNEAIKVSRLASMIAAPLPPSKPWRMLRYTGWRTQSVAGLGGIAFGQVDRSRSIMQVWGELADRNVMAAVHSGDVRPTRVDYAVTVLFSEQQPAISERLDALRELDGNFTAIVPVSEEGGTLYVGSRESEKFGRLYDKGAELGQGMPSRLCWRYEVEFKRSCARSAAEIVTCATHPIERIKAVIGNVFDFFTRAGVECPTLDERVVGYPMVKYSVTTRSIDRTLNWLSCQVNPALLRLVEEGLQDHALEALGITGTDGLTVRMVDAVGAMENLQSDFLSQLQLPAAFDNTDDAW